MRAATRRLAWLYAGDVHARSLLMRFRCPWPACFSQRSLTHSFMLSFSHLSNSLSEKHPSEAQDMSDAGTVSPKYRHANLKAAYA